MPARPTVAALTALLGLGGAQAHAADTPLILQPAGNPGSVVERIAVDTTHVWLVTLAPSRKRYIRRKPVDSAENNWLRFEYRHGDVDLIDVAPAPSGDYVYFVTAENLIWGCRAGFEQQPDAGQDARYASGELGTQFDDSSCAIIPLDGAKGTSSPGKPVRVVANEQSVWITLDNGEVYRRPLAWDLQQGQSSNWTHAFDGARKVAVGSSGRVYAWRNDDSIWACDDPCSSASMEKIAGSATTDLAVGGGFVYAIEGTQIVRRPDDATLDAGWEPVAGSYNAIGANADGWVWAVQGAATYRGKLGNTSVIINKAPELPPITATGLDVTSVTTGLKVVSGYNEIWQKGVMFAQKDYRTWVQYLPGDTNDSKARQVARLLGLPEAVPIGDEWFRPVGQWIEVKRDRDAVYLRNYLASGETLVINMTTKQITGALPDGGATRFPDPIIMASNVKAFKPDGPPPRVAFAAKGTDVSAVQYGDDGSWNSAERWMGTFEMVEPRKWSHRFKPGGAPSVLQSEHVSYTETNRDEWSVYLKGENGQSATLNLWTRDVTVAGTVIGKVTYASNWEVKPPLTPEERAAILQQERESNYYSFKPALSKADLNEVMVWIAGEVAASAPSFCWRESYGRGVGLVTQEICEFTNGPDPERRDRRGRGAGSPRPPVSCEYDTGLWYPTCTPDKHGVGPVCWQRCPTAEEVGVHGRNVKFDCGAACATSDESCASAVVDMVFGPINVALNVASFGLNRVASGASQGVLGGAAAAATQTALASNQDDLFRLLKEANDIIENVTEATDSIEAILGTVEGLDSELRRWGVTAEAHFHELATYQIERVIDAHFPDPDDRSYIKQKYAQFQLTTFMATDGWEIADKIGNYTFLDPTGIAAAVLAFAHPVCDLTVEPFPKVTIIPKDRRDPPDTTTRSRELH